MTRTKALAIAVVVILVVVGIAAIVLRPTATAWRGNVDCTDPSECKGTPPACILYTGQCVSGKCRERLRGGADCAGSWYRESTDSKSGVTSLATCNTASCTWNEPVPCGLKDQSCCARGACSDGSVCSKEICRAP